MNSLARSIPTPSAPSSGARLIASGERALPLRHTHLAADAGAGLCRTVLTQRFVNPHDEPLHVTYLLPLPADGAVSGFSFILGERRVVGEVDLRRSARERFERALAAGQTSALLEQDRSALFTQEIGNVPPKSEIVCEVVIDQPLAWVMSERDGRGAWEWRFPTVLAPRYQGAPGHVLDASKLTVDVAADGIEARASLALKITDSVQGALESPSHRVSFADGQARFESASLDRDVVVRWPVAAQQPGVSLVCTRPTRNEGETFGLLTLVPPQRGAMKAQSRDLVLLLDTSGSMAGRPLDQLKRVSLALIDTLGQSDRLEMIEFSNTPTRFAAEPIRTTRDGKEAARKWVQGLNASGGTEMHRAVLEALAPLRADAQRQIILMTDGFIGFEREIVDTLMRARPERVRLHTVGVGSAPNRTLTEGAARAGNGAEILIGLSEDAERGADRLVAATAEPLVTELRIEGADELAPGRAPDLFAGSPALMSIRAKPGTTLIVRGRTADGAFEHEVQVPSLELGVGAIGVAARFARQKVEDLEMSLCAGAAPRDVDASIEELGLRFQIATRLTSWIAVTQDVTVDPTRRRREHQPHELPEGVSMESLGLRAAQPTNALFSVMEELTPITTSLDEATLTRSGVVSLGRASHSREGMAPSPRRAPARPIQLAKKEDVAKARSETLAGGGPPMEGAADDGFADAEPEVPAYEVTRLPSDGRLQQEHDAQDIPRSEPAQQAAPSLNLPEQRSAAPKRRMPTLALFLAILALVAALLWWALSR